MRNFLTAKTQKTDPKAAITNLIVKGRVTFNFVATDPTLKAILSQYMNFEIPVFKQILDMLFEIAQMTIEIIKEKAIKNFEKGQKSSVEFDEQTSISQIQMIVIVLNFENETFHLGIQKVLSESCNSEAIIE